MKKVIFVFMSLIVMSCNNTTDKTIEETKPSNSDRIMAIYDAFAIGDIDTVLANFTEDINWMEAENYIYADGNPYIGKTAVLEGVFGRVGAEWEYWNLANTQFANVEEDQVLVTGRYQAKHNTTGKLIDAQFAHLWTMKDTLAASFQQYADTKQVAEAIISDEE